MQITVTFDSLEEFKEYMGIESPSKIAQAPQEAPKKSEAKKAPEKARRRGSCEAGRGTCGSSGQEERHR